MHFLATVTTGDAYKEHARQETVASDIYDCLVVDEVVFFSFLVMLSSISSRCMAIVKHDDVVYLQATLDVATENWGIMVERVEM